MFLLRSKRCGGYARRFFSAILLLVPLFLNAQNSTDLEQRRRAITDEADSQLIRMSIYDSEVSLLMNGFWKGKIELNWGLRSGPLGTAADSGDSPLLFTQEADLTLSLWLRQKWFLEVNFLDDYSLNTYRAGYQGFPGETVQYAGAGNTGLDFPVFPYLDLGGDSPSSFGGYGRFGAENLIFHTVVRYDAAAREERVFLGGRERTFSTLSPEKALRGISFVLPHREVSGLSVYFEDKEGDITETPDTGRRWRLAKSSEYAASGVLGIVELVREARGMIAVSYNKFSGFPDPEIGTYTVAGFLKSVQDHFAGVNLSQYPQSGQTTPGLPGTINFSDGARALVIYEPGTFSPFERRSRYRAPSAASEDAALILMSSGERVSGFELLPAGSLAASGLPLYVLGGDSSEREIFELTIDNSSIAGNRRMPEVMWPLASDYPEIYLPGKQSFTGDLSLRFTNYGPEGAYTIGTDVVPGSVQVYRSGIPDLRISYEAESGTVRLESPAGFNELIRVSYLKRSEERKLGSIAAGAGMVYKPEGKPFGAEAALGLRWNLSGESFTEEGSASPGTAGFGGRVFWDYGAFRAGLSLGLGFEQPDTTGIYRVAGMEGNSGLVMALSTSRAFISGPVPSSSLGTLPLSEMAGLVYRNYRNSDILGVSKLMPIGWSAPVVAGRQGPYPAEDAGMEIFGTEFDLDENGPSKRYWTGFQVPLGEEGVLEGAKALVIPLRYYDFSDPAPNMMVAVQFGVLSDGELGTVENPALTVEQQLFTGGTLPTGWINDQSVTVVLDDAARRKLQRATHMRIIVVNNGSAPLSGRLLTAKPYVMGASWRAITVGGLGAAGADDPGVSLAETADPALAGKEIDRLHPSGINYTLKVDWNGSVSSAGADGRTGEIPLLRYRVLSFFLKTPDSLGSGDFHFVIAQGPGSLGTGAETERTLEVVIPSSALFPSGKWVKVELEYQGKGRVLINGMPVPSAKLDYRPRRYGGTEPLSVYLAAYVDTVSAAGTFSIDEICLLEPAPSYRVNAGSEIAYTRREILTIGGVPVLSDFSADTAFETAASGNPFDPDNSGPERFAALQSRSRAALTVLGAKLYGNFSVNFSSSLFYWTGGHGISHSFGPFSASETFNTAPLDKTFDHVLNLSLDTPLYLRLSSGVDYEVQKFKRAWDFSFGIDPVRNGRPGFFLGADLAYAEKTLRPESWMPGYGETWVLSFLEMIPDAGDGKGIQNRSMRGRLGFTVDRVPAGAALSLEGSSLVSLPRRTTRSSLRSILDIPFDLGVFKGNLRNERNFSRDLNAAAGGSGGDFEQWGDSAAAAAPLWLSVPVYAIFDPGMDRALEKTAASFAFPEKTENALWYESLSLNFFFPGRYDSFALLVPVNFSSRVERNLEKRLETRLDIFSLVSSLGFSGLNLFGSMGTNPVFGFYRNDEFRHSVSLSASFPKNEDPVWRIQAEQNLGFFGFRGSELGISNTLTAGSSGWMDSLTVLWTVPMEKTLLSRIYDKIMGGLRGREYFPAFSSLAEGGYEVLRRESFEMILDHSGEYGKYIFVLGHESIIRILGKLTLSVFGKLNVTRDNYSETLSFMLNFGTSLTLSF
jgi:hypothetical protein